VHDVDAALPFYAALDSRSRSAWARRSRSSRAGPGAVAERPGPSASRPLQDGAQPAPGGWNRIVIEVEDLDAAMVALRPAGARFRSEPIAGPGGRQVLVEDPSGNPVELFQARAK